ASARIEITAARDALQARLLGVMVRTERVGATARRDSMVEEHVVEGKVDARDVGHAVAVDRVRRAVGGQDIVEYWKSAPYLLSFMKGYDLVRRLDQHVHGIKGARRASEALMDAVS